MADSDTDTNSIEAQKLIATGGQGSLDGYTTAGPQSSLAERPELVAGGAFLVGLIVGILVSRIGS